MPIIEGHLKKLSHSGDLLKCLPELQFWDKANVGVTGSLSTLQYFAQKGKIF